MNDTVATGCRRLACAPGCLSPGADYFSLSQHMFFLALLAAITGLAKLPERMPRPVLVVLDFNPEVAYRYLLAFVL